MAKRVSMTDKITEALRMQIVKGEFSSDSILTEIEISQMFGGSKTPAREALGILCSEGLLEKIPNKGYLIKRYTITEVENLIQFRNILDTAIVELVIQNATDEELDGLEQFCIESESLPEAEIDEKCVMLNREFHVRMARLSHNMYLVAAIANVMDQMRVAMGFDDNREKLLGGHRTIVKILKDRDLEGARKWANRFSSRMNGSFIKNIYHVED